MERLQKTARVVGALFLIAMAASLLGGGIVESLLAASDYYAAVSENKPQLLLGVLLELMNGLSVLGIAVLMFPILKNQNENAARSYLCLRLMETVFCLAAVMIPLALIKFESGSMADQELQAAGSLLIAARAGVMEVIVPVLFCLGASLFYYLLYQSRILPRFLPIWGIMAVILLFAVNLFGLFQSDGMKLTVQMGLALPIILNEIFLGIWLIVKGFKPSALVLLSNRI